MSNNEGLKNSIEDTEQVLKYRGIGFEWAYENLDYINLINWMDATPGVGNKYAQCLVSILDTLKLHDKGQLVLDNETLSQMMFRKMKAYNIDLNKECGFNHLKPIKKES